MIKVFTLLDFVIYELKNEPTKIDLAFYSFGPIFDGYGGAKKSMEACSIQVASLLAT